MVRKHSISRSKLVVSFLSLPSLFSIFTNRFALLSSLLSIDVLLLTPSPQSFPPSLLLRLFLRLYIWDYFIYIPRSLSVSLTRSICKFPLPILLFYLCFQNTYQLLIFSCLLSLPLLYLSHTLFSLSLPLSVSFLLFTLI